MPKFENLASLINSAYKRGCEATLSEIAQIFEMSLDEHPFEMSAAVERRLYDYGLVLCPPLPKGSFETLRLVRALELDTTSTDISAEIDAGESSITEFKKSFAFDHDKFAAGNYASRGELRSEFVIDSSLKTIAAFMNSDGGTLYIGVDDHGGFVGILEDFEFLGGKRDSDGFELFVRDKIKAKFLDGNVINNFTSFQFCDVEELLICRISVTPRRRVSYFKRHGQALHEVFVRQGNRTVSLNYQEFEMFLNDRA